MLTRYLSLTSLFLCSAFLSSAQTNKATYASDDKRTGWYADQPLLDPATVGSSEFGKIFDTTITGQVYAQPLVSNGVLFVATESNWIYGLDPVSGATLWSRNLGPAWNAVDGNCGDLAPTIGVTGTPVIDGNSATAYFLSKTYRSGNSGPAAFYMHAVDVMTGAERPNFPVLIAGTAQNDQTSTFDATRLNSRPALLLMNGVVYGAFGAMCDIGPYKGWIIGVSTSGQLTAIWDSVPGALSGGGIWQSGGGLVSDQPGRLFCATGNGYASTPNGVFAATDVQSETSQSVLRLAVQTDGSLKLDNFFSPYDALSLDSWDADFGSGSPTALPEEFFGTPSHPKLLVVASKQGYVYLLDRDNLGGQKMGSGGGDAVVNRVGPYGGVWSRPAVWPGDGGYIYIPTGSSGPTPGPTSGVFRAYQYGLDGTGKPSLSLAATSIEPFGGYSSSPIVTSDGTTSGSGMVWIVRMPDGTGNNAQLLGYEATPAQGQLMLRFSAPIGQGSKFVPPGVGPARLYVGTRDGHLLGFGVPATSALTAPFTTFGPVTIGETKNLNVTLTAHVPVTVQSVSSTSSQFSVDLPALPVTLEKDGSLTIPVHFTPTQANLVSGALGLVTNLGPISVSLSGSGRLAGSHLQVSPAVLSLGGTSVGKTLIGTATIANSGAQSLILNEVSAPGNPFFLSGAPASNSSLAPGQALTLTVQFSPTTMGSFTDAINIVSNGGNSSIKLSGSATLPGLLDVSTKQIQFGALSVGASNTLSFDVSNAGLTAVVITKSKPPILGAFHAISTLDEGIILQPGESKTLAVCFTPIAAGVYTDSWTINSDSSTGLQTITFTGTAQAKPGSISAVVAQAPAMISLSDSGVEDWVHWGLNGTSGVDRLNTQSPKISSLGEIPALNRTNLQSTFEPVQFSWIDGNPIQLSNGTTSSVGLSTTKTGFLFSVPADLTPHTLTVYIGVKNASGHFVATLSDASAPAFVDDSLADLNGQLSRVYHLTYQAAVSGQRLTINWIKTGGPGSISVAAASFASPSSPLTLKSNSQGSANLTTEGSVDWIHWGKGAPEHKRETISQFNAYDLVGNSGVYAYENDPRSLAWTDGQSQRTQSGDNTGVFTPGEGSGFTFAVPADQSRRQLSIHVGGWNSSGTLTAHLSDGSQTDVIDSTPLLTGPV